MMYLKDRYKKEFETKVKEADENKIILEDTIFYSESGGQACDEGKILRSGEKFAVVKVKKENGNVVHYLNTPGLKKGDKIKCLINWKRRYKLMRSHTAAHILGAMFQKEMNVLVTGNQITTEKIRMDFNLENPDREILKSLIAKSNEIIKKNLPVSYYEMKREEIEKNPDMVKLAMGLPPGIKILRIVKIGDFDEQPDAGTHVKNTSEIGELEFLDYETRGKNNKRIYVGVK